MATVVLPAQNCLDEERVFMSNPRRKSNRSKRKSVGESRECDNGKLSLQMSGLNPQNFQKNGSFLSPSRSFSSQNLVSKTMSPAMMHLSQAATSDLSYLPWKSVCYGSRTLQSSVDAKKSNGAFHQVSRTLRPNGSGDFQQQLCQKGAKNFLLDKTEGAFRKEGLIDGINNRKIGNDLQMGQVTIFKKGEAMKSASLRESALTHLLIPFTRSKHESKTVEASKRQTKISAKTKGLHHRADIGKEGRLNNDGIAVTSTERFGPDPSNLPREGSGLLKSISLGLSSTETVTDNAPRSSWEAVDNLKVGGNPDLTIFGVPAFTDSPPPSCLPLPKFSLKQNAKPGKTQVGVNTLATRDLRRLLGLD